MSTFNAGAVEATLTLNRSSWVRDLDKTKKEIEDLERKSVTIGIELSDDDIQSELDRLSATLEKFEQKVVKPELELDTDFVEEQIQWFEQELDRLDDRKINIEIDVDTTNAQIALDNLERGQLDPLDAEPVVIEIHTNIDDGILTALETRLEALDNRRVTIEIDVDDTNAQVALDNLERGQLDVLENDTVVIDVRADIDDANVDALERKLDRLERQRYMLEVDADVDNALIQLSGLEAILDVLDGDTVVITVDVDSSAAEAKLIALAQFINAIAISDPTVNIDVDGYARATIQMATLQRQIAILNGQTIDIDVDIDRAALRGLLGSAGGDGSGGHLGLLRILLYALIALSPILVVAFSALSAAVVAFAAALVGALGPAIVVAGGLFGLIQRFNETPIEDRSPEMQAFADAIENVKDAWETTMDLAEKSGAFGLMADALNLVADILPRLEPIFSATVDMLDGVLSGISDFVNSSEFDEMIEFFTGFGTDMLRSFLTIGGNLIRFFGRLFDAIAPFATDMMKGLEAASAGWAETAAGFTENEGFIRWLEQAREYGPQVLDFLGSFWDAIMNISEALRPFAGPMLDAFIWLFDFIADMDPDILTILIGAFAGLWAGMNIIVPMVSAVVAGLSGLVTVLGFLISPVGIVVALLAGLIATVVYLWQTNEDFREGIIDTWNAIYEALYPIITDIVNYVKENWEPFKQWVMDLWRDIQSTVVDAFIIMETYVRVTVVVIAAIWRRHGEQIKGIVGGFMRNIGAVIKGTLGIISGVIKVFAGIMRGDWSMMWEGIKRIQQAAMTMMLNLMRGLGQVAANIFRAIGNTLMDVWRNMWENLRKVTNAFKDWVGDRWEEIENVFKKLDVGDVFGGIRENMRSVLNAIVGWWNGLSLTLDIPDKIPGLPDSFTISTPNVAGFAEGGYVKAMNPVFGMIGEGSDNEIIAPEPVLERIIRENSGAKIDYGRLAAAIVSALATLRLDRGVTPEDLERLIEAASVNIEVDARSEGTTVREWVEALSFEMRTLGYGGVATLSG